MQKKGTNVLLSIARDMTPRAKLNFKSSKEEVSRIKLRYFTLFYLEYFLRYGLKSEIFHIPIFVRNYKITT